MKYFSKLVTTGFMLSCLLTAAAASAETSISLFNSKYKNIALPQAKINQIVKSHFDVNQFRDVKVQVIYNQNHTPESLLVYLFSKKFHSVKVAKIAIDGEFRAISIKENYKLTKQDYAQQPGILPEEATCPDPTVQFIAFAPNAMSLEQNITVEVAKAAEAHGLKTIRLLKENATRSNYLNYMACPLLKGNFYDGDANPELITTYDGVVEAAAMDQLLKNQFKFQVTNIWLACEAFNDPMKTTMLQTTQSQKYAAGVNNLLVGPSDRAAACTMEAAIKGEPMTPAFKKCYDKYDKDTSGSNYVDHWGFDGQGSDYFGA